jgi:transposase
MRTFCFLAGSCSHSLKGRDCVGNKEKLDHERDQGAKAHLIMLMQAGYPWHKAVAATGLHISRSTAYRLVQAAQTQGEAAFQDKRQGHPGKLRDAILQWLVATCHAHPQMPSREVQAALQEQFGISVSIGHLNRVRAQLGMKNHRGRSKKNHNRSLLLLTPNGRKAQELCSSSPLRTRLVCWKL